MIRFVSILSVLRCYGISFRSSLFAKYAFKSYLYTKDIEYLGLMS